MKASVSSTAALRALASGVSLAISVSSARASWATLAAPIFRASSDQGAQALPSQLRIGCVLYLPHETLNFSEEERQHLGLEAGVALRASVEVEQRRREERRASAFSRFAPHLRIRSANSDFTFVPPRRPLSRFTFLLHNAQSLRFFPFNCDTVALQSRPDKRGEADHRRPASVNLHGRGQTESDGCGLTRP